VRRWLLVLGLLVSGLGCHGKQEVTAPPPPLRPEPEDKPAKPKSANAHDCDPVDEEHELKALTFDERSIPEGMRLADDGLGALADGNNPANDKLTREDAIAKAVKAFITALEADPYNVKATYNLAAAYAKIDRRQCALNLLTRLLQMRPHASKRAEVEAALDRLLGRKQALDPNFSDMRSDERFRHLIQKMCEGTNDPNCVYGGQKDNRER
jgi:tetratricopeptide (TPR) repeat protein